MEMDDSRHPARPRLVRHEVEVVAVTDFTAWYRRITFDGHGLRDLYQPAPGAHLMINLESGLQRAYSVEAVGAQQFWFEFVLHTPAGPGCGWAAGARVGTRVTLSEPPYALAIPATSAALLIGDTSALLALRTVAAGLDPAVRVRVVLQDPRADRGLLPGPTRGDVVWVDTVAPTDLERASAGLDPQDCFVWAAGERQLAKTVRDHLRAHFAVPRPAQHVQTYWIGQ
jgi:NADPH-dependent ferric siderophore reductase